MKTRQLVIYIEDKDRRRLKLAALKEDRSVTALVNQAIREYLAKTNGGKRG